MSSGLSVAIALALKPLYLFVVLTVIGVPVRYAIMRWMKDGKLKRLLLWRIPDKWGRSAPSDRHIG